MTQELPVSVSGDDPPQNSKAVKKLTLIPLIFLIYFEVAGGPFGEEPAVQAAGPLYALLGFLIFPFIWSVPEALITAELSTAIPGNGGFVVWADMAFGPFFGSLMGTWKLLSGIINVAAFPILCVDYLEKMVPELSSGPPRFGAASVFTVVFSFLNYTGLSIVGWASVALGVVSLAPFMIMSVAAVPKIEPGRWLSRGEVGVKRDWNLFFNTLFWNLNFWDSVSTLAGEVERPKRTFPRALLAAVVLTCAAYLVPLFAVIGAVPLEQEAWESGFHAVAAEVLVGRWLKVWIEVGAVLSAIGLFEAQLSSCAYQVLGMAEIGALPKFFGSRSKIFGTPWIGILIPALVTLGVSFLDFTIIISSANFLYSLGMLLEFASFVWLRRKFPTMKRPYKVPLSTPGLVIMCLVPSVFLVFVMAIGTKIVFLITGLVTACGVGWFFLMRALKEKKVFEFNDGGDYGRYHQEQEEQEVED